MTHGRIICGFPGVGKTYFQKHAPEGLRVFDSDSSNFSWARPGVRNPDWPNNYLTHIESLYAVAGAWILVSSHAEVRAGLVARGLPFALVYPALSRKEEYLQRYRARNSSEEFLALLEKNWNTWIQELCRQPNAQHYRLGGTDHFLGSPFVWKWIRREWDREPIDCWSPRRPSQLLTKAPGAPAAQHLKRVIPRKRTAWEPGVRKMSNPKYKIRTEIITLWTKSLLIMIEFEEHPGKPAVWLLLAREWNSFRLILEGPGGLIIFDGDQIGWGPLQDSSDEWWLIFVGDGYRIRLPLDEPLRQKLLELISPRPDAKE